MKLIGLDPSFTNTGIAMIDILNNRLVFKSVGSPIGEKTFSNIVQNVYDQVNRIVSSLGKGPYKIITETPPAAGNFSSGLFALDTHLSLTLRDKAIILYGVSPVYLAHIHGTRKYKKSESVAVAKKLIGLYEKHGFITIVEGRLSADMSEAFIFATRLLVINNDPIHKTLIDDIIKSCKGFKDSKEFIL